MKQLIETHIVYQSQKHSISKFGVFGQSQSVNSDKYSKQRGVLLSTGDEGRVLVTNELNQGFL